MLVFHATILFMISCIQCAPTEHPTYPTEPPTPPPDQICLKSPIGWDQTGYFCNEDRTGYYYCDYDYQLETDTKCPPRKRCNCGSENVCWVDKKDDRASYYNRIRPASEGDVCEFIPPADLPLPDPALFTYRGKFESEFEDSDKNHLSTWSGEVRQDIKNGKYMSIDSKNSNFYLQLGLTKYYGNLKKKSCTKGESKSLAGYWTRDQFLKGYTFEREHILKDGAVRQAWIKSGTYPSDPSWYFYVSVKDGFTLIGEYSYSESQDWDDEDITGFLSSHESVHYNTTYGVDSTHWFDIPSFC